MSVVAPAPAVDERVDRWARGVFVAVAILAVPWLLYLGRDQWFFLDEWFVLGDGADSLDGFFDAHNGHWSTVVTVVFRGAYAVWGLDTYVPYQVPVVVAHVGAAVVLRVLMRQLGVRGWIATAAALIFVFFGSGNLNIFFGFQISQTGSLLCGLALFVIANHDGQIDRRDWFGLAVGFVGLTTSGIFVPFVVGVGVAALLRRGLRVALFYTVPLGIVYGIWYLLYGREDSVLSFSAPGEAVRFAGRMLSATFSSLGGSDLAGVLLGLVVVGTVGVVLVRALRSRAWAPLAVPAGLLTAWVTFATLTALARASGFGAESGASDRYLHISAGIFLPLVALGAEYLARRKLLAGALPVLLLAAGLPHNIDALANRNRLLLGNPDQITWLAHSENIDDVPPGTEPVVAGGIRLPITTGWLAREAEAGHIPKPTGSDPAPELSAYGTLALRQQDRSRSEVHCPRADRAPVPLNLVADDRIVFEGEIRIAVLDGQGGFGLAVFTSTLGSTLVAELGPLDLAVRDGAGGPPRLCEPNVNATDGTGPVAASP